MKTSAGYVQTIFLICLDAGSRQYCRYTKSVLPTSGTQTYLKK